MINILKNDDDDDIKFIYIFVIFLIVLVGNWSLLSLLLQIVNDLLQEAEKDNNMDIAIAGSSADYEPMDGVESQESCAVMVSILNVSIKNQAALH